MRFSIICGMLIALCIGSVHADERTRLSNLLLIEQTADSISQINLEKFNNKLFCNTDHPNCAINSPYVHNGQITENDPFARPFVHSLASELIVGTAINVFIFRNPHLVPIKFLRLSVELYPVLLYHQYSLTAKLR